MNYLLGAMEIPNLTVDELSLKIEKAWHHRKIVFYNADGTVNKEKTHFLRIQRYLLGFNGDVDPLEWMEIEWQ